MPSLTRTHSVELIDLSQPDHAQFMYDLALACKDDFLNDVDNDIILMINHYERAINNGNVVAFIAKVEGANAGIVWVEKDGYGTGRIRAGLLPSYRRWQTAQYFLRLFIDYCFNSLDFRKLDAEIIFGEKLPNGRYAPMPRGVRAAEKLLRRFGFKKQGINEEALMINGRARDSLLLALTRNRYKGLTHVKKQQKQQQAA